MKSDFKTSIYNFYFEVDSSWYVYNTLAVSLGQLDEETKHALESNNIEAISDEYFDELVNQRFIVESNSNELDDYLYFYNRIRLGPSAKLLSITLVPTYNCNLACPYCLQGLNKKNVNMTLDDVDKILLFAEKRIQQSYSPEEVPITKINAKLYGGEPTMMKRCITRFCDGMSEISKKYNCEITYSMVSNMTLFDDELFALFEKYNIITQVSIDGLKCDHDKRRIDKKGRGTYDTIMSNLKEIKRRGLSKNVVIRINLDTENIHTAEDVMTNVHEFSPDVYYGYLEQFNGFNDGCSNCIDKKPLSRSEITENLNVIMRKHGYIVPEEFGKMAPCAINVENKFFIDCYRNVYKCELALNQPELAVGTISDDGEFVPNGNFYKQMSHSPEKMPECLDCKLLPLCGGGCSAKAYIASDVKDGNLNRKYCMCDEDSLRIYLEHYVRRLLAEQN